MLLHFLLEKDVVLGFEFVEAGLEHGLHVVDLLAELSGDCVDVVGGLLVALAHA